MYFSNFTKEVIEGLSVRLSRGVSEEVQSHSSCEEAHPQYQKVSWGLTRTPQSWPRKVYT